jgi:hypothetical protein
MSHEHKSGVILPATLCIMHASLPGKGGARLEREIGCLLSSLQPQLYLRPLRTKGDGCASDSSKV